MESAKFKSLSNMAFPAGCRYLGGENQGSEDRTTSGRRAGIQIKKAAET
jgi:hypothetical protein